MPSGGGEDIKETKLLLKDDKVKGIIVLFEDGRVGVCSETPSGERTCYVTSKPSEKVFYIAQAWFSNLGMKIASEGK